MQLQLNKLADIFKNNAVFFCEKEDIATRGDIPAAMRELTLSLWTDEAFKGEHLSQLSLPTPEGGWLFLIGLGKQEKLTPAKLIEAGATAGQMAQSRQLKDLNIFCPVLEKIPAAETLELLAQSLLLSSYRQTEYKSEAPPLLTLKEVTFTTAEVARAEEIIARAEIVADATNFARRLTNMPPNMLFPASFAQEAQIKAQEVGLEATILDEAALTSGKFNLHLAVGQGSDHRPHLAMLKYQGGAPEAKPVVLVGKGVTLDSGGMSLKPSTSLVGMKTDMAGAASVLGAMVAVARLRLPINVVAIMPLVENMLGGGSFRVGDVITARSGKTVEITNTDAEGRLILADALNLAGEQNPALIIDLATLTGACVVALGDKCAGLFTTDEALGQNLQKAAKIMGEELWPLPLLDIYEDSLKSDTADMVNVKMSGHGGALTAALFLRRFVPEDVPWAHIDIAGPSRAEASRPGTPVGGTGFAVRTLIRFLTNLH